MGTKVGEREMPSEQLIERLNQQASQRKKREIRLLGNDKFTLYPRCYVVRVDDGLCEKDIVFREAPTLAELAECTSSKSWIVSVRTRGVFRYRMRLWLDRRKAKSSKEDIRTNSYEAMLASFLPASETR